MIASTRVPKIVTVLEQAGCKPRRVGPGLWLAICPSCRSSGRTGLLELRQTPAGITVGCEKDPA
jgi:hypothetical protein